MPRGTEAERMERRVQDAAAILEDLLAPVSSTDPTTKLARFLQEADPLDSRSFTMRRSIIALGHLSREMDRARRIP